MNTTQFSSLLEDAQELNQSHRSLQQAYSRKSYFNKLSEEEQIASTKEQPQHKSPYDSWMDLELHEESNLQEDHIIQQDSDFTTNKKMQREWLDHFQIPYAHISNDCTRTKYFVYQLQFNQANPEEHSKNQNQNIISMKSSKDSSITFQQKMLERRARVDRYLQKKAKRCFIKKISYECRKTVADQRIRIKGRFVNKRVAEQMLKVCQPQNQINFQDAFGQSAIFQSNKQI